MLQSNSPAIGDFESSRVPGATLVDVKRTYGWHDLDVNASQASNDPDAMPLSEMSQFYRL